MPFHREETNDEHELVLVRWLPRLPELRHEVQIFLNISKMLLPRKLFMPSCGVTYT